MIMILIVNLLWLWLLLLLLLLHLLVLKTLHFLLSKISGSDCRPCCHAMLLQVIVQLLLEGAGIAVIAARRVDHRVVGVVIELQAHLVVVAAVAATISVSTAANVIVIIVTHHQLLIDLLLQSEQTLLILRLKEARLQAVGLQLQLLLLLLKQFHITAIHVVIFECRRFARNSGGVVAVFVVVAAAAVAVDPS